MGPQKLVKNTLANTPAHSKQARNQRRDFDAPFVSCP